MTLAAVSMSAGSSAPVSRACRIAARAVVTFRLARFGRELDISKGKEMKLRSRTMKTSGGQYRVVLGREPFAFSSVDGHKT